MKLLENTIFDSVSSYIICNAIDFLLDVKCVTDSEENVNMQTMFLCLDWSRTHAR